MSSLRIELVRGSLVESVHRISAAVVDADGRLLAATGDPDAVTPWRSAAKPFQALPLLLDGAADRFGFSDADLALACASHSSEPMHVDGVSAMLDRIGVPESALACGPHPPLDPEVAAGVVREGTALTERWSNCSGKHAGLLALARHHGWPLAGYERLGHPVQDRIVREVTRFTGVSADDLVYSTDGCTTVCFGVPIRAMALAYARFGASDEAACRRLRAALTGHPDLVAGTRRFDSILMAAWPGRVIAKVGAEGVYSAAIPDRGWGVALKVQDGAWRAAPMALLALLTAVLDRAGDRSFPRDRLASWATSPILSTRGERIGEQRPAGELRFFDS